MSDYKYERRRNKKKSWGERGEQLRKVYLDTRNLCYKRFSKTNVPESIKYKTDDLTDIEMVPKFEKTLIQVINEDTFVACSNFDKACALNMASLFKSGGGCLKGAPAQEECLFRKSNLFMTLLQDFYPLEVSDVIYSPNVTVVKDINYKELKTYYDVSVISAPAFRHPKLKDGSYLYQEDYDTMCIAIDNVFKVAYKHNEKI